jgi:uncharacterized integral membrane protein
VELGQEKQGTNWRAWLIGLLIALVLIVALQNSQEVEVEILFIETKAPLIAMLLIAVAVGVVIGYVAPLIRRHRRDRRPGEER